MKAFTTTDLSRKFGEVAHSAAREPVAIVQRGEARYVPMSMEDFDERRARDPREVHTVAEMPDDLAEAIDRDLTDYLEGRRGYDD